MAKGIILGSIGAALVAWLTIKWFSSSSSDTFNPEMDVAGKNVLLTGASSGIGHQMAFLLCEMGANVFVTARRENILREVVEKCRSTGRQGSKYGYHQADMGNMEDAKQVVLEAAKFFGRIDYLILNHAYVPESEFHKMDDNGFARLQNIMNVNFFSFVKMMQTAMPYLVESSGRIAVVSSDSGEVPHPLLTEYCTSKFAVNGFFGAMDLDLYIRNPNVSISIALLGAVDTPGLDNFLRGFAKATNMESTDGVFDKASPRDCAYHIVRAAALREPVTYFPNEFALWGQSIMNKLFLQSFRDSTKEAFVQS